MEASKLESFSDGVFAVAMTLLIFQVQIPHYSAGKTNSELIDDLQKLWPYYVALFTSFFTLLIMWVNHHTMLKKVQKIDRLFLFANGSLLFLVIIVPFPTAMVSQFLRTPSAKTACAVYAGLFLLINLGYNWVWYTASHQRKLLIPTISDIEIRKISISNLVGVPIYLIAFGLAFTNPFLSMVICILMWIYWALVMKVN